MDDLAWIDPKIAKHLATLLLCGAIGGMVSAGRFALATFLDRRLPSRLGYFARCSIAVGCITLSAAVSFGYSCLIIEHAGSLPTLGSSVFVALLFDALSAKAARQFGLLVLRSATGLIAESERQPQQDEP